MAGGSVIYTVSCEEVMQHSVAFANLEEAKKYRLGCATRTELLRR